MAEQSLFTQLKRLFSGRPIVRNVGGKQLKVVDTDNIQASVTNAMRDRFSRVMSGGGYGGHYNSQYGTNMAYQAQRLMLFRDYDTMDNDPLISSALDVYADESTVKNEYGDILTIESDNAQVKDVLHNLFYDILNIEFNLWPWVRNMCKYGDFFLFLEISPEYGILNVLPLSHYDTIRVEGEKVENPHYVYFETLGQNGFRQKFENYEVAHFRLLSDTNFLPYGKSMIEGGRRIFRQLTMMEDAMMIHRIMRAPEKRIFKIDIGNIPPNEVEAFIQKLIDRTKKVPFIDPATGDYNLRYNIQNLMEDFYLPVRGSDSGTDISNLPGLEYNPIEDVEYLQKKLFAALKIPKAFIGYDEDVNGKATLAAEDVRFARTIERIQRIIVSELKKIAIVHLYAQGFVDEDLVNFSLSLTMPSTIYEQEKINLWTQKASLVTSLQGTKLISDDWIYEHVFHMSKQDAEVQAERMLEDTKKRYRLTQIEAGQSDPLKFGFPQDKSPEENPNTQGGGDALGAGGSVTGGAPASVDDLPSEEDVGLEEDEELRGQPRKGPQYAQDSHVRGRDPLGYKERYRAMKIGRERAPSYKPPLSLEIQSMLSRYRGAQDPKPSMLVEHASAPAADDPDSGTYLDERNLFTKPEDTQ